MPVFPAMRIFALEFIRQTLKADQIHFVPTKKEYILKLPTSVGPFTVNLRHALSTMEMLLQGMDLLQGKVWPYDPKGILSNRKRKIKLIAYVHETRPFIEWRANLDTWPLDAQMETESSAAKGRGDTASAEIERKGQEDEASASGGQAGRSIDEEAHPSKKQRTEEPEIVWEEPPQEEFSRYGLPDRNKVGFMINFDSASSSEPSGLSQAISVNRAEVREEISTQNRTTRDRLRAELVGFVDKYHTRHTTELDMDKEQLIIAITEAALQPTAEGTSYRALELALNLANIPITDKFGLD